MEARQGHRPRKREKENRNKHVNKERNRSARLLDQTTRKQSRRANQSQAKKQGVPTRPEARASAVNYWEFWGYRCVIGMLATAITTTLKTILTPRRCGSRTRHRLRLPTAEVQDHGQVSEIDIEFTRQKMRPHRLCDALFPERQPCVQRKQQCLKPVPRCDLQLDFVHPTLCYQGKTSATK